MLKQEDRYIPLRDLEAPIKFSLFTLNEKKLDGKFTVYILTRR